MMEQTVSPILEVHDMVVSYNNRPVLWNVDFSVPKGKLVGIVGPNGAGKSTLIKAIMGLVPLSSGFAKIFDNSLANVRQKVSYVPQRESVDWEFPISVREVVEMGRYSPKKIFRRLSKEDKQIAKESLEKVGMSAFADRQISELSGGQQQRVFLARSLAQQADLYFMDEPFAGVDAATEKSIIELLKNLVAEGKTILVVHHDLNSALDYFDWMIMLNTRLIAAGETKDVFTAEVLQKTYGGKLSVLSQIGDLLQKQGHPVREN
ncbi:MAG: metal ABC transporter ATP-binding protein [Chitinophagales bacterium]